MSGYSAQPCTPEEVYRLWTEGVTLPPRVVPPPRPATPRRPTWRLRLARLLQHLAVKLSQHAYALLVQEALCRRK
jgi:hypothetical protein